MLVTERMRSLGDQAKSSRQPPVKERKYAKAVDESAAQTVGIDEDIFDNGATHESTAAALVENVTPQIVVPEGGDDATIQAAAVQEDDSTAKRAIIHEWENWSALHSDELNDAKVHEYFFQHIRNRKPQLLHFALKNMDHSEVIARWVFASK